MKKHVAAAPEFGFKDEGFALLVETTLDGERVERERRQRESDKAAAEARQTALPIGTIRVSERIKEIERDYHMPFILQTKYDIAELPCNGRWLKSQRFQTWSEAVKTRRLMKLSRHPKQVWRIRVDYSNRYGNAQSRPCFVTI